MKAKNENSKYEQQGDQTFEQILDKSVAEHQSVGDAVDRIRELADEFTLPEDACASYTLLYKMLDDFERSAYAHPPRKQYPVPQSSRNGKAISLSQ